MFCCFAACADAGAGKPVSSAITALPGGDYVPGFYYSPDRANKQVRIEGDGSTSYRFEGLQPYFDENGFTMLPMVHFEVFFSGQVSYEMDGGRVTITKNVLDVITVVSVTAGSNILLRNGQEIVMDTMPVQKDETIYIPLEYVGDALGYGVYWNERQECVKFYPYTSVFVFIWNESEDSLDGGLRYAYTISGNKPADMALVMANPAASFREVCAVLKKLSKGAYILTTTLYRAKGHHVSYDALYRVLDYISDAGLRSSWTVYCLDTIPPIIKDLRDFTNWWYSEELFALEEEAIYDVDKQIYRFSYFPAFTNQMVMRIEVCDDGTADIYYKVSDGEAGVSGGGIARSEQAKLSATETAALLALLKEVDYWELPVETDHLGCDGYMFVIEGVKDGVYHIVNRWVPEEPEPVHRLEAYFWVLIKEKFAE